MCLKIERQYLRSTSIGHEPFKIDCYVILFTLPLYIITCYIFLSYMVHHQAETQLEETHTTHLSSKNAPCAYKKYD